MLKVFLTLLALWLSPVGTVLGQEGRSGSLATSDVVVIALVTAMVIGGLILYEYLRVRGTR
jgi:hypothetical protein